MKRLLEREHQLHETERIGAKVVDEARFRLDLRLVDVELLPDDSLDLARNVRPQYSPSFSALA